MRTRQSPRIFVAAALCALVLGACGGGGGDGDGDGVASLAGSSGQVAAASGAAGDDVATEEEILAWVECMREEGLDIADPTVDADGNLQLGGGPRGGIAGDRPGGTTATTGRTEQAQPFDRETFQAASDKCGEPPRTGGGFSEEDREELQETALKFAQCLRDEGLEVADPDFSAQGPGGPPRPAADESEGDDAQPQRGGLFGGLDLEDPTTQAAFEKCQSSTGGFPGGGRGGPPAARGQD